MLSLLTSQAASAHGREREIGMGSWSLPVRAPRIADVPPELPRFRSAIVPARRYWTRSSQTR